MAISSVSLSFFQPISIHGMRKRTLAVSTNGEAYVSMAGRLDLAKTPTAPLLAANVDCSRSTEEPPDGWGDTRARSTMKLPKARFVGVRGS